MLNMLPSPAEHPAYTLQLPHDPRAPSVARATIGAVLTAYGMDKLTDMATLLACELVTNAYEHSHGPSAMRLRRLDRRFRVSVWDADPHIPVAFRPYLDLPGHANDTKLCADRGRGLLLIQRCADTWGGYPLRQGRTTGGKLLWFELTAP